MEVSQTRLKLRHFYSKAENKKAKQRPRQNIWCDF